MKVILPLLYGLGCFMITRMMLSIYLFFILPSKSKKLQRKVFMKIGGGLYAQAKFPMMTMRQYVVQLQRFNLFSLDNFDKETVSSIQCRLCQKQVKMDDDIVVLPCDFQHFFMRDCIHEYFDKPGNERCPICKFQVFDHHNYQNLNQDTESENMTETSSMR